MMFDGWDRWVHSPKLKATLGIVRGKMTNDVGKDISSSSKSQIRGVPEGYRKATLSATE
jgi:hypothetical protein